MRKIAIVIGTLILFSLSFQTSAFSANNWYAGLQVGPEFLTADSDENLDDAAAFGIYAGYRLDRQLSLEGGLTTASHDGIGDSELNITTILFGPRISGQVNRGMNIYAGAGLGIYFLDYKHTHHNDSDTESGLYLGAGVEFPLQQKVRLGMDFKYHALFDNHPLDSDIVTLLMRVGFDL